jgi:hypothetical protein
VKVSEQIVDMETGEIEIEGSGAAAMMVAKQEGAALDVQVATAKAHPRSVQAFQSDLKSWATLDRDTAMECFFNLRKGSSSIVGPSIRFAELVQASWGNIVVDTAIVAEEHDHVVVSATCRDLERNTASRSQVRRNILDRKKRRYSADMIQTTVQAASAIARRNAIFQVVPRALWAPIYKQAQRVAGGEKSFAERRKEALSTLKKEGVPPENIKAAVSGKDPKDLTSDDVLMLEVAIYRVGQNESTWEAEFPDASTGGEGETAGAAADALSNAKAPSSTDQDDAERQFDEGINE